MSRPESPLKNNISDEDTIKKLKALLIKEKRINKENIKIINDLKIEDEKKGTENNLLINQIKRLSENIGNLDDKENNNLKEIENLKNTINELNKENDNLKFNNQKHKIEQNEFQNMVFEFENTISSTFTLMLEENKDIFMNKLTFTKTEGLNNLSEQIFTLFSNIKNILRSSKDVIDVLQDGIVKINSKCDDLEHMLAVKDEKINLLMKVNIEFDQKEEQIKRLGELIEDNRNISRALETERDQLQNDLVDLRQRHEEKEAYLIEEYREAQLSLENYRIFVDKQSAEKANEVERLRTALDEYKQNINKELPLSDYTSSRNVESLFYKIKLEFGIEDNITNFDDIFASVINKYNNVCGLLNEQIENLTKNESLYRNKVEVLARKLDLIEQTMKDQKSLNLQQEAIQFNKKIYEEKAIQFEQDDSLKLEFIEELNRKLLGKEDKLRLLQKEMEQIQIVLKTVMNLLEIDESSSIIDSTAKILSMNKHFLEEIQFYKNNYDEQKDLNKIIIQEKDSYINELVEKLTEAGRHVNHNDLMNLEMAEIDKTLVNLNNQLLLKSAQITNIESILQSKKELIETLTEQIKSAQKQIVLLEERNNKMKQMLVKTKRDLTDYKGQLLALEEKDSLHMNEVERLNLQLEETKVLLSDTINENEQLHERYSIFSKKMDSIVKNREMTIGSLRSQTETTMQNYKGLQQEYDLYKVKVQTAFNTKLRSSATFSDFMTLPTNNETDQDDMSVKSLKKQIIDLETRVEDLKIDLHEKEEKIFALNSDLDVLRWDSDKISEKFKSVMKENNELTMKTQQIVEQLQNDAKIQQMSHSDMLQKFNIEKENLSTMYQIQIESIRSDYENELENLNQKIEEKEIEKVKFQEELWDCRQQLKTADNKFGNEQNPINETWTKQFKLPLAQERQQGEGMEMNNETETLTSNYHNITMSSKQIAKSGIYNNTFLSLDQLLNSSTDTEQVENEEIINKLKIESNSRRKKNEHLMELLSDSEATVSRLTEQAMLLKTEIRRLENNQERDNTLEDKASKEYLKNVIIKFLHYDTKSDERSQLIPVIVTLLSLDSQEKELLTKFSRMCTYNKRDGEGWSSYFTWAGMS